MVALSALLVPILVATVLVFIASFLAWMVLPHHKSDWGKLPDEEKAREALKGTPPGQYTMPHAASKEDWKDEGWQAKIKAGPNAMICVLPNGMPNMGKSLVLWFIHCLFVSFVVAYLTGRLLGPGTDYLEVFQIAGTAAWLAYSFAHVPGAIWMGRSWSSTIKDWIDGLVYALLTAGAFGWLWP